MTRISIFPLPGAVLYPGLQLPLHIFEPRYRAMVSDALARDRKIGMIQPQQPREGAPIYAIGCLGKIGEVEALPDGRFNLVLEGETRFRDERIIASGVGNEYRSVTHAAPSVLLLLTMLAGSWLALAENTAELPATRPR